MKNRVTTGDVEIWSTVHPLRHITTRRNDCLAPLKTHFNEFRVPLTEYIAMLTPLITFIGDMPLKSKVFHSPK
jgi:hypothetical protein